MREEALQAGPQRAPESRASPLLGRLNALLFRYITIIYSLFCIRNLSFPLKSRSPWALEPSEAHDAAPQRLLLDERLEAL